MRAIAWRLVLALVFIGFGTLVYLTGRLPADVPFLPEALSLHGVLELPAWAGALPSFFHVAAFALLTGAALPTTRRAALAVALVWVAVDGLFEAAQHPAAAELLGAQWAALRLAGTFDPLDLAAAALGGLAAWSLLRMTATGEA